MKFNKKNIVSFSEANQDFLKVAQLVDESGVAIILKNNVPRYILLEYSQFEKEETIEEEEVNIIVKRLIYNHKDAFKKLAK